jgi:hypothetical protein
MIAQRWPVNREVDGQLLNRVQRQERRFSAAGAVKIAHPKLDAV